MAMIPQDKIEEVRERTNIVQVVSDHVALKKVGTNHVGLCPFHSEKTPSFTVSEEKQIFYCFGCNTGGNVFSFLMRQENLSFPEAVRVLARRVGVDIPSDKGYTSGEEGQRELMFLTNRLASEFYHHKLLASQEARDYLEKRAIRDETIRAFQIGYAPKAWDELTNFMAKKGYLELAEKIGLIVRKADGGYYDRFRERIVFPIMDIKGRVTGFAGRTIRDAEPKYLNSPESPLFKKGGELYGLYQAKGAVSKEGFVLVVEGYFDLLALHQHGFKNSVATMGTALSQGHLRRLRGYAKEVYTLFDSDPAGRKAVLRVLPLFLEEGIPARVVLIPEGVDPDDLLNTEGSQGFSSYIQKAQPIMDFFIRSLKERFDTGNPRGKVSFLEEVVPYLVRIRNVVERGIYIELVAHTLDIGIDVVASAVKVASIQSFTKEGRVGAEEIISIKTHPRAEENILKVLLFHPEFYSPSVKEAIVAFKDRVLRDVGMLLIKALTSSKGLSSFLDETTDEVRNWIAKATINKDDSIREDPKRVLEDSCKRVLMMGRHREETEALRRQLESAHERGDGDRIRVLAKAYLERKRKGLIGS